MTPFANTEETAASRHELPALPDLRTVRILLIDDDPQARALIDVALADAAFDCEVEIAAGAIAGLDRIGADAHDVYLVDHQLPDGNGVDVIRRARAAGATKPFILLTGHGNGDVDQAASREGAADYVEKHMVSAQLERSIRYALRNWQSTRLLRIREDQLRHAQKMEAIGRLAGAVAHDFNNLLTAIIGYADLLGDKFESDEQTSSDVGEIRQAADRAAQITRQLLSFSRKQFLDTTLVDVNESASALVQVLPSVVGEQIRTAVRLGDRLPIVKSDPARLEQVLIALVLNAREAMPDGGELTIETAAIELTAERAADEHLDLPPGRYATIAVRDTGIGMPPDVRARVFEPFFTTKPKGHRCGLGLATAYGILHQSGGSISIDTTPHAGTTVRLYLPATDAPRKARGDEPRPQHDTGTETLLVVDDNDAVRAMSATTLRRRGYVVHECRGAEEALQWAASSGIAPQLLVTDVVMPGLSGPSLAARLLQQNPRLRVLYMSGYTDDPRLIDGAGGGGAPLLEKPFTPAALAERVRRVLDADGSRA
jgi:signal transduction histidine kinase